MADHKKPQQKEPRWWITRDVSGREYDIWLGSEPPVLATGQYRNYLDGNVLNCRSLFSMDSTYPIDRELFKVLGNPHKELKPGEIAEMQVSASRL